MEDIKAQRRKKINKKYYESTKDKHKEKMLKVYHDNKKYEYIIIYLYDKIDDSLNKNFIQEFNEAVNKCNENNKFRIKIK